MNNSPSKMAPKKTSEEISKKKKKVFGLVMMQAMKEPCKLVGIK
jgi:hypothetical protein